MSIFPRPTKQFDFLGKSLKQINQTQRSLIRRTDFRGGFFDDSVAAQSKEETQAMRSAAAAAESSSAVSEVNVVTLNWEDAEGYELNGPTYLTLQMDGQDLLKFNVGSEFNFQFYSNTRNYIDVTGPIERL